MGRKKGFTLVELLIVIALLTVLAALLFPVFSRARGKASQTTCLSNERQIGTALALYEQDFDGTYPNFRFWPLGDERKLSEPHSWRSVLRPYLLTSQAFTCPANPDNRTASNDPAFSISYAANVALNPRDYTLPPPLNAVGSGIFGKDLSPGVKAASVVHPAECIAVVEIVHVPNSLFVVDIAADFDNGVHNYSECLFTGHFGLTNFLLADGHVKALKPTATYRGNEANFWYRDASPLGAEARTTLRIAEVRQN